MKRHFIGLGILMFFLSTLPAYAGAPLDTVQTNLNKVLDVLRDPKLKPESAKEIKKEKLDAIYEQMFDEVELSMRTLGGNWNKLNPAQQKEFVQLYRWRSRPIPAYCCSTSRWPEWAPRNRRGSSSW